MAHLSADNLLQSASRIVIKFGSSLVATRDGLANSDMLASYAQDIAALRARGAEVIVVTSGAIALGRSILNLTPPMRLDEKQAAAAAGQTPLTMAWQMAFDSVVATAGKSAAAQILLTLEDTEDRKRYLNAKATIETLLSLGAVPLVNENDTIATSEIRYGDNDRLAAHTAQMLGADLLVLLSDIDGLYKGNPTALATAEHIPLIHSITSEIEGYAQGPNEEKGVGSGGMTTKIAAARIATDAGSSVLIANGLHKNPLRKLLNSEVNSTLFVSSVKARTAKQDWIAGRQKQMGTVNIDAGAVRALATGSSLLCAGIIKVSGDFHRGDLVLISGPDDVPIASGLAAYDSDEIDSIKGVKSEEIESILGYRRRPSFIHRDDMVLISPKTEIQKS